jgi:ribosomal protein L31
VKRVIVPNERNALVSSRRRRSPAKRDVHPDYHPVVFRDSGTGDAFLTRSTATSDKTIEWSEGRTYPVVDVEISSYSADEMFAAVEAVFSPDGGPVETSAEYLVVTARRPRAWRQVRQQPARSSVGDEAPMGAVTTPSLPYSRESSLTV